MTGPKDGEKGLSWDGVLGAGKPMWPNLDTIRRMDDGRKRQDNARRRR